MSELNEIENKAKIDRSGAIAAALISLIGVVFVAVYSQKRESVIDEREYLVSEAQVATENWTGTWKYQQELREGSSSGVLEIQVASNSVITGECVFDDKPGNSNLEGVLSSDGVILEGTWQNLKSGQHGAFRFKLSQDGSSFSGTYSLEANALNNASNHWDGQRSP